MVGDGFQSLRDNGFVRTPSSIDSGYGGGLVYIDKQIDNNNIVKEMIKRRIRGPRLLYP